MSLKEQENKLDKKISESRNEVKIFHFKKEYPSYQAITVVVIPNILYGTYKDVNRLIGDVIVKAGKEVATSVDIIEGIRPIFKASGIAFCHHKECSCNKTLGRVIAKGRLLKSLGIDRR